MLTFGAGAQTIADAIGDLNGAAGNTTTANGFGGTGGVVALQKAGGGTLTLNGANTYRSGTLIANGTLVDAPTVAGGTSIGAGAVTFAGTSVGPAILTLGANAQPVNGATFANTITNFGTYDGLDLKSLAYSAALGNGACYNAVTSQLTVTENGESENYALANAGAPAYFAQSDGNGGTLITDAVVCFCSGTRIRVARGEVSVEDLQVGDLAITLTGDLRAIRWLGHRTFDCRAYAAPEKVWPIRVAADAFGRNPAGARPLRVARALAVRRRGRGSADPGAGPGQRLDHRPGRGRQRHLLACRA